MTISATIRMSPEQIVARAGGEALFTANADARSVFAGRAMRARQLGAGQAMGAFLLLFGAPESPPDRGGG